MTMAAVWGAGDAAQAGIALYGSSLIAMISCSFLYNHLRVPDWTPTLRALDHGAIYVKIAATYTPFALLSGSGLSMLATIWAGAALGIGIMLLKKHDSILPGVVLCLGMGWAVVFGGRDLIADLSTPVVVLMVLGGVLYSAGVPFLLACRMRYHNTIWHAFVMVASLVFFVAIFIHLAQAAPRPL